ncbi:hypothetical protein [Desulfosarcina cetonica]|uniref:hypothetical protein n=1 Tax=Desulfosarcina cetonica TaxID=90730 RepID=UPI0012ED47E7|nr:hypothetical protein [Desulfosarcina cetonica]
MDIAEIIFVATTRHVWTLPPVPISASIVVGVILSSILAVLSIPKIPKTPIWEFFKQIQIVVDMKCRCGRVGPCQQFQLRKVETMNLTEETWQLLNDDGFFSDSFVESVEAMRKRYPMMKFPGSLP